MTKSSESLSTTAPPPTSFSSLPNDVVLNCLARISKIHRPTLSLVSKSFGSIIASRELHATRTLIGKTEDCHYVCLNLNTNNTNHRWFTLAPIPQRQKLLPGPGSFPIQHLESSTIASIGSEMYLIGGVVKKKRSRKVLVLDCRSHRWRRLRNMIIPREKAAVEVIDGKIYVIGGCEDHLLWGEVYDPKTQIWESLSNKTLDLTTQMSMVPGSLVMGGKVYEMNGLKLDLKNNICLVEMDNNVFCQILLVYGKLLWCEANKDPKFLCLVWKEYEKLSPMSYSPTTLVAVAKSGRKRVTVWWKTVEHNRHEPYKTDIWCAEILIRRQGVSKLKGFIEWSKPVFTFYGPTCDDDFFLHSALVNH